MKTMNRKYLFLLIALAVVILDQITKLLVMNSDIVHIINTGAGFGLFKNSTTLLIWISVIVLGFILYKYNEIIKDKFLIISTSLLFGGTLGNLIDRIRLEYVVDFIDFKIWPSFNLADSAITIGGLLLVYYFYKKE